ncbi:hypothetical protein CQ009_13110 [Pseudomonas sp. MYb2]|jgi:hypothetical protein|uniref:DUF6864 domain-containing function n=1 Tax=unclassified Pseudomonas TaxID=196821 RepID=UPI000D4A8322|nr:MULTISPECIES: hypothetical protein [unclassified Pseudomonas]PRC34595.1 hypothetical protein CQ009_13110 [Pseudomonas sp. MYb2]
MFEVTCKGPYPAFRAIAQGISFGTINKPIVFEVKTETISVPLLVNFYVRHDPEKSKALFVVNDLTEGNSIDLEFYNIVQGSSGLTSPASIATLKEVDLQFFFQVDKPFEGDNFRLSYQFFETEVGGNRS